MVTYCFEPNKLAQVGSLLAPPTASTFNPTIGQYASSPRTQGLLLHRTRRLFPSSGRSRRQFSFCLPMQGCQGRVGLDGLVEYTCKRSPISVLTWLNVE